MSVVTLDQLARMDSLRRLHQECGWRFRPAYSPDPPHELDELVYGFPHGEWLDVLRVRSDVEAVAGRFLSESVTGADRSRPKACWLADGTLGEVLDRLAELPASGSRLAPRLLLPAMWRPRS